MSGPKTRLSLRMRTSSTNASSATSAQPETVEAPPAKVNVSAVSAAEKEREFGDDPNLATQFNEIILTGNREGLQWLGAQILKIAEAEPGGHTHLDRDANGPIYKSQENWWLTIRIE